MHRRGLWIELDRAGVVGSVGPLAEVDGVSAPVEEAGTGVEVVVAAPAAADILAVVGAPRRRAEPPIPVADIRVGRWLSSEPVVLQDRLVGRGVERLQLAELAGVGKVHRIDEVRHAAPLRARLEHPAGFGKRGGEALADVDRDPARLFAVDVLARFGSEHRGGAVPAVAGGDENRVDLLAVEQFVHVARRRAVVMAIVGVDHRLPLVAPRGLDVGDREALDVGKREHGAEDIPAARADADHAEADPLTRCRHPRLEAEGPGGDNRRQGDRGHARRAGEEVAAGEAAGGTGGDIRGNGVEMLGHRGISAGERCGGVWVRWEPMGAMGRHLALFVPLFPCRTVSCRFGGRQPS